MLAYVCAAQQPLLAFALRVLLLLHGLSVGPAAQTVPPPPALTLHVRAGGGDEALAAGSVAADGSVERPFRSIHAARDHLRLLRRQQPLGAVRVQIAPGRYPPLELTAEDSGASLATPITYEGECVDGSSLISAGVAVPASAFRPWPGHRGVLMADLSSFAIERGELGAGGSCYGNCTMFRHNGVVFGSRSMVLARYPNIAMNTTTFELPTVYSWIPINHGHNATLLLSTQNDSDAARVAGWAKEAAPWVHIYASFDWDDTWHPVTIQTNRTRGGDGIEVQVSLLPAWTANSTASTNPIKPSLQSRFYGANLLSELDSPGEYMIVNDTLYFYPPIPLEQWDAAAGHEVVITSNLTAVHASADHVVLKNLAIRHARGNGVLALNVTNVRVEGCSISGHGQHGVVIVGSHSGVEQSDIFSVGCSGVRVAGGDARSLTHGHSFARHNTITDFALHKRAYSPGVFWNGVGNDYSFNNVSRSPHNCISGGGNVGQGKRGEPWGDTGADAPSNVVAGWGSECTIEGNRLDTCAMECGDCGAFYTCGQAGMAYVNRGNRLVRNTFSNIHSANIYLDDAISGWEVAENAMWLSYPTLRDDGHPKAVVIGGGRDTKILGNTFDIHTARSNAVAMDGRGGDCAASQQMARSLLYPGSPWGRRYPELFNVSTDHPCTAAHGVIANNRYSCTLREACANGSFAFFSDDPLVSWDDDTPAQLRAWTTVASNNSRA